jgi:MinD-like ATPase involved in chromosome partitioning or flagellar assembly
VPDNTDKHDGGGQVLESDQGADRAKKKHVDPAASADLAVSLPGPLHYVVEVPTASVEQEIPEADLEVMMDDIDTGSTLDPITGEIITHSGPIAAVPPRVSALTGSMQAISVESSADDQPAHGDDPSRIAGSTPTTGLNPATEPNPATGPTQATHSAHHAAHAAEVVDDEIDGDPVRGEVEPVEAEATSVDSRDQFRSHDAEASEAPVTAAESHDSEGSSASVHTTSPADEPSSHEVVGDSEVEFGTVEAHDGPEDGSDDFDDSDHQAGSEGHGEDHGTTGGESGSAEKHGAEDHGPEDHGAEDHGAESAPEPDTASDAVELTDPEEESVAHAEILESTETAIEGVPERGQAVTSIDAAPVVLTQVPAPSASAETTPAPLPATTPPVSAVSARPISSGSVSQSTDNTAQHTRRERLRGDHVSGTPEPASMLTADRLLEVNRNTRPLPEGGWNKFIYGISFHAINLGDSKAVRARKAVDERIRKTFEGGTRFVPILTRKGGVGKTTVTTLLGMALAATREDRIIAIDANPDRGTLAERVTKKTKATVRDVVHKTDEVDGFTDFSDFVSRDTTRLDILASDTDPQLSEAFDEDDYNVVADLTSRFYSIVLTDCGTGIVHSVMRATLQRADSVVIVSGGSIDEARLASETLTWLEANGYGELVRNAVVAINTATQGSGLVKVDEIEAHFRSRVRDIVRIPYDPQLAAGSVVSYADLKPATVESARLLAALVVDGLPAQRG